MTHIEELGNNNVIEQIVGEFLKHEKEECHTTFSGSIEIGFNRLLAWAISRGYITLTDTNIPTPMQSPLPDTKGDAEKRIADLEGQVDALWHAINGE